MTDAWRNSIHGATTYRDLQCLSCKSISGKMCCTFWYTVYPNMLFRTGMKLGSFYERNHRVKNLGRDRWGIICLWDGYVVWGWRKLHCLRSRLVVHVRLQRNEKCVHNFGSIHSCIGRIIITYFGDTGRRLLSGFIWLRILAVLNTVILVGIF